LTPLPIVTTACCVRVAIYQAAGGGLYALRDVVVMLIYSTIRRCTSATTNGAAQVSTPALSSLQDLLLMHALHLPHTNSTLRWHRLLHLSSVQLSLTPISDRLLGWHDARSQVVVGSSPNSWQPSS